MKIKKFFSFVLVFVLMATLILPAGTPAMADNSSSPAVIDVNDSSGTKLPTGVAYDSVNKLFTIGIDANNTTITVSGSTAVNTIVVAAGVTGLTLNLNGVSITTPSGGKSPIDLQSGARVTLTLAPSTSNTLDASSEGYRAGIHSGSGSTLTINGTGMLIARGGACAAGIGGSSSPTAGEDGGTITINAGADVQAYGGQTGAGIGGSGNSSNDPGAGGVITIAGNAHVTATGGAIAAGIGGVNAGAGGIIHIGGSAIVNATATSGGAGIGGGGLGDGGNITIDGGTVTAVCSSLSGAGIGGGNSGGGGNITINGGTVMAIGDYYAAGIGAGYAGVGANLTIGASAIVMAASNGVSHKAIHADSGSGSVINAWLGSAVSGSTTTYLKCGSAVLRLPADYRDFAFSASAATSVGVYSDQGCAPATFLGSIVTKPGNAADIPVADLNTNPTDVTSVKYLANSVINVGDSNVIPSNVDFSSGVFTIDSNTVSPITIIGTTNVNTIAVASGVKDLSLILNGVSITSPSDGNSPIDLKDTADVTIQLAGGTSNTLDASSAVGKAGLHVPSTANVMINGTGSLIATGGGDSGSGGAGIGGGTSGNGGTIVINSGHIDATGGGTGGHGGAGIGGGSIGAGGNITITGGTVIATGGDTAAGIGGGRAGAGGTVNISGGFITATGVDYGAGIGGGWQGASCVITISGSPNIIAASAGGGSYKPAIDAANGSSGSVINAMLNSSISTSKTYLKCNGNILPFPGYDKSFAFSAAAASAVQAYSDLDCNALMGIIVTDPAGVVSIPVTDLSTNPTSVAPVKLLWAYTAPVTVYKDGSAWTSGTPTMQLSTSSTTLTGAVSGVYSSGVYTFSGLIFGTTYYIWDQTGNQYTGKTITNVSPSATINYYTVVLTSGTGIDSTTGSGTYLKGRNITISAAISTGYNWSKWAQTSGGALVTTSNLYTIPNISSAITYTANAVLNPSAPGIVTTSLPNATVGTAYSQSLVATSLVPLTLTWSVTSGALPAGLTLNGSTGVISGTPSATGTGSFTVTATDSNGSAARALTITVVNTYALTVNLNGGSGATSNGSYASGASVSINAGTKSGYTFSGWTSSAGGTFGNTSSASTTYTMPGNATTITATWTPSGGSGGYVPPANNNTIVIVDNKDYSIGTENKNDQNTTATVDQPKLTDEIAKASDSSSVIVPVSANTNVTAQLVVKNVEDMAKKDMVLTVQTGNVAYNLNTSAIDTSKITASLGNADSKDIPFNISISNSKAVVNGATVVVSPVEFTITATYNGKTTSVDAFRCFVDRTIEITADQAKQITTAVVVQPDGSLRHVPTKVKVVNGKYYAVINSLTNSTYTVVWHPIEFSDVTTNWAKNAINDMGSRMIVTGVGNSNYEPDRDITRAEFAAIVVRALGLAPGTGKSTFSDVDSGAWYCGYIATASAYGIIKGYSATTFGPSDTISREQAMTMISRAMEITGLNPKLADSDISVLLGKYSDSTAASDYAKSSICACLKTGIISGRSSTTLAPKDFITRAEVAVVVQRLLQKSELI